MATKKSDAAPHWNNNNPCPLSPLPYRSLLIVRGTMEGAKKPDPDQDDRTINLGNRRG